MAIVGLCAKSQELLQESGIDTKDFSKARIRYDKVREELKEKSSSPECDKSEVSNTIQQLADAWNEYLALIQDHFQKVTNAVIHDLVDKTRESASASERAEKLNELCAIGEKWYVRNEAYISVTCPEKLATLIKTVLDSCSRVMRLLGLQLVRIFAADVTFTQSILSDGGSALIGLSFDREIATELEYVLNICSRLIELHESNPGAFSDFPYGWIYRISSLLDVRNASPWLAPKRRTQALRIAIKLLRRFPAMSTAASLHTILLRYCIRKGAATKDEIKHILNAILDVFDVAETRQYISYNDLDVLYAPFLYSTDTSTEEKINLMNGAKDVLALFMQTWIGVLWTSSETKGLRAIIDILHLPGDLDRKMILLTLFNKILCQLAPHRGLTILKTWNGVEESKREPCLSETSGFPDMTGSFMGARSPQKSNENVKGACFPDSTLLDLTDLSDEFVPTTKAIGYHVLDPLLGRVLLLFSHHGLPLALINVLGDAASSRLLTLTASSLLQDILVLMDTVLPVRPVKRLHTALNEAVGRLVQQGNFSFGSALTLRLVQDYKRANDVRSRTTVAGPTVIQTEGVNSRTTTTAISAYGFGTLELDDTGFQALLRETGVEKANSFAAWNYDLLLLLVHGPLRSLPRFQWVLQETTFFQKLIAFYMPLLNTQTRTFVSLQPEECTPQLCNFGLALLDLFLSTRVGTEVLYKYGFSSSIVTNLQEVCDGSPQVLNKQRLGTSVGLTVIRMIGQYSLSANGLMAMKELNMFSLISNMFVELTGDRAATPSPQDTLQDVCQLLLRYLYIGAVPNYGVCEEIRQIVRSALCNDVNAVRLCAALLLRKSLWRDLSTSMRWGIETLVQALHDDFYSVVETAFKLLLSICLCSDEALDYLISLSPTVLMESDVIHQHTKELDLNTLLYSIVGRPSGFRFLQCYGWVEEELRRWELAESANYVVLLERMQSGEHLATSTDLTHGIPGQWRQRHNHTISDPFYTLNRPAALFTGGVSMNSNNTLNTLGSGLFPPHFAAVLCKSNEGCTLFKHSDLWQRSVERILNQPLPPDIVYDDGNNTSSDSSDVETNNSDNERKLNEEDPSFWGKLGGVSEMAAVTESAEARALRSLSAGRLPCSQAAELLSAARGYKTPTPSYVLQCVGNSAEIKDAILCVCHASSSDTGFALMRSVPGLHKRLNALMIFGATISVRSICLVGECVLARSRRGVEQLSDASHYVLNESNAYTSSDGVPYSVAFSHIKPSKWTPIGRTANQTKLSPLYYIQRQECAKVSAGDVFFSVDSIKGGNILSQAARRVFDQVCALSNPVSREGAKKRLYHVMKHQPHLFLDPLMRKLLRSATQMFCMHHTERKFIADLLENAPLAKLVPSTRRATVVFPPS